MKLNYLIFAIALILSINLISAIDTLPTVKKGDCINIPQVCSNCTYNNISSIAVQGNTSTNYLLRGEYSMEKVGITYNYTFCNTTIYGTYLIDGHGDLDGLDTNWGGISFVVNGSGQDLTSQQTTLIIILLVALLIVAIFLVFLSFIFKHPGTKIFFMALAVVTIIVFVGMINANASIYLAEFPTLINVYDNYYIVTITLSGAAMLGLIVWFIYYAFTLFNKSRGRIPDD